MKVIPISFFAVFLLAFSCDFLFAQDEIKMFSKKFEIKSGLPKIPGELVLDANQKVLVSGVFGVNVFDGISWKRDIILKKMRKLSGFLSITKNKYQKEEYILIGRNQSGFIKRAQGNFFFTKQIINKNNIQKLKGNIIKVIQYNNQTYFLSVSSGGAIYNHITREIKFINALPQKELFTYHFYQDNIYLQTQRGSIYQLKKQRWKKKNKVSILEKYKPKLIIPWKENKYIVTSQNNNIYITSNQKSKELIPLSNIIRKTGDLTLKIKNSHLYIAYRDKLIIFDLLQERIIFEKIIENIFLHYITIDKQGNVWASTNSGVYFIECNIPFTYTSNKNVIYSEVINGFKFDFNKDWVQFSVTDLNSGKRKIFDGYGPYSLIIQLKGKIYICSEIGIYYFDQNNFLFKQVLSGKFYSICASKAPQDKQFYLFTGNSLIITDERFNEISKIPIQVKSPYIRSIYYNNHLYFSSRDQAFKVILSSNKKIVKQIQEIKFPGETAYTFAFETYQDHLYINHAFGMFKVDLNHHITNLTKNVSNLPRDANGNPLSYFSHTRVISQNKIFVCPVYSGTNLGVNIPGFLEYNSQKGWSYESKAFKRLDQFHLNYLTKVNNTQFNFILEDHIISYDSEKEVNPDFDHTTYIRQVALKTIVQDTLLHKQPTLGDSAIYWGDTPPIQAPKIPYHHNTLNFTFASDSWAAYERNEYSYQLVGVDESWSNWSKEQKKEYTSLREGTYTFKVRSKNVYGTIGSTDTYTFTILPPWYRSSWAYAGYGALALLFVGGVAYANGYRLRSQKQKLEVEVNRQTQAIRAQKEEITQQAEELKTANDQLNSQTNELKVANKQLNQLGEFKNRMTHMIVHDLKNPLASIIGLTTSQTEGRLDKSKISSTAQQMLHMVQNILDVQKAEEAEVEFRLSDVALGPVIQEVIAQQRILASAKNINLRYDILLGDVVTADTDILIRIFSNLISNAIKFTPENGEVSLYSSYIHNDSMLKIEIHDTGVGIPAAQLDKVFDQFHSADKEQSGNFRSTGLGLTFCKMAVEKQGGEIGVNSKLDKGSQFWFTLPLVTKASKINPDTKDIPTLQASSNIILDEVQQVKAALQDRDLELVKAIVAQIRKQGINHSYPTRLARIFDTVKAKVAVSSAVEAWMQMLLKDASNEVIFEALLETKNQG